MSDIRAQAKRDAEFDRLLECSHEGMDGAPMYKCMATAMRAAYEMGDRHRAEQCPQWHDAPTCAGLWVIDGDAYDVYNFDGTLSVADGGTSDEPWEGRWYGPIPADGAYTGIREVHRPVLDASGTDEVKP